MRFYLAILSLIVAFVSSATLTRAQTPGEMEIPKADEPYSRQTPLLKQIYEGTFGGWADATLADMSTDEKIGQLFMVPVYTNKWRNTASIDKLIREHHVGGLIFMQGSPMQQVKDANHYQQVARMPLIVAQDSEWGAGMRLDSIPFFPRNMTLGAINDDSLIYRYGEALAAQCRALGVHMNFAPVVDVNINPANPVINVRSFGEDPQNVAHKAEMLLAGMQSGGVVGTAKHFPGHGDTGVDSHLDLPVIRHNRQRLDEIELYPYRYLIERNLMGAMIAHLYVPALDNTPNLPASLSPKIVNDLLIEQMGFHGLIVTDALNMGGATKHHKPGDIELKALLAGHDILLFPNDIPKAVAKIKAALKDGTLTEARLNRSVRKILWAKEWLWLHKQRQTPLSDVWKAKSDQAMLKLRRELYKSAVTVAKNERAVLPLKNLDEQKIAYVQVGGSGPSVLYDRLRKYTRVDYIPIARYIPDNQLERTLTQLQSYTTVIIGVYGMHKKHDLRFGISSSTTKLIERLQKRNQTVVATLFGYPYGIKYVSAANAIVMGYETVEPAQEGAAEVIFGGRKPTGKLPIQYASVDLKSAPSTDPWSQFAPRFAFGEPEDHGFLLDTLHKIPPFIQHYIREEAMPGCALLVLHGNDIVMDTAFGHLTYNDGEPVDPYAAMYDLASVTKVIATTMAAMKLYEQGKLDLWKPLVHYLPETRGTNKAYLRPMNLMLHNAGLRAHVPYWERASKITKNDTTWSPRYFSEELRDGFSTPVTHNLFLADSVPEAIWADILDTKLLPKNWRYYHRRRGQYYYEYSDLGMIIMGQVVERIAGERMEYFLQREFYEPLGMNKTAFMPQLKCMSGQFPPTTEKDPMRGPVPLMGFVNDENACLMGGYAGHAGLFSNVYDLAKILQMLKNGGEYGGKRYLKASTIAHFTSRHDRKSRRGIGWDKPETRPRWWSPVSRLASPQAYGHEGFTGTCLWVDPKADLVFVLLSNRTYPTRDHMKYVREKVRHRLQDKVFRALFFGDFPQGEGYGMAAN